MQQKFLSNWWNNKLKIITPAIATSTRRVKYEEQSDSNESANFEEEEEESYVFEEENGSFEEENDAENSEENESADDGNVNISKKLHKTWCHLSLPINEIEILGKWFAEIHKTKRSKRLCIGQLWSNFFKDENRDVDAIEMRCLKSRVGLSTVIEDTTDHLPDIGISKIQDAFDGTLEVLPLRGKNIFLHISGKYLDLIEKP